MDNFNWLLQGFAEAATPMNLLYAVIGVLLGTAVGVLPGIGPAMTVALLLPITYNVSPSAAFIMFAGIFYGGMYGGSTTSILLNTPGVTHIRRYLGQVSDRMAEHYVHLSNSDLEDVLQQVWVAGPGAAHPGELLTTNPSVLTPMTREQAQALAIDLSRRATPAEGGFCTFQPVVDGGACPWQLDCHNCDKFVLSGADLLYWRRKREQWRQLAEGAPDNATADYLHRL